MTEPYALLVLVTGSRNYVRADYVVRAFEELRADELQRATAESRPPADLVVMHGACGLRGMEDLEELPRPQEYMTGADAMAQRWAEWQFAIDKRTGWHAIPADWRIYGRSAGPRRNRHMVMTAGAWGNDRRRVCVLAFPSAGVIRVEDSTGTANCVRQARLAGLPVAVVGLDGALRWDP